MSTDDDLLNEWAGGRRRTRTAHLNRDGHLACRIETWLVFFIGILTGALGLAAALNLAGVTS